MLIREGEERVIDLVIVPSPYAVRTPSRPITFFEDSHHIFEDVWLAHYEGDFADAVMDACSVRGENFNPTRQYGGPYGFIRTNAPQSGTYAFDSDGRLTLCVGLSRLAHPSSINYQYAARIRHWPNGSRIIAPVRIANLNHAAFVSDEEGNWLIPDDVPLIRSLVSSYYASKPPVRLGTALWHFETAFRSYYVDTRWPLLATGLEALVHIGSERDPRDPRRYAGSTRVFVKRIARLAAQVDQAHVTESILYDIYDRRSGLVHGQGLGQLDAATRALYETTEKLLAAILRRGILDTAFAGQFVDDSSVQAALPLT